MPIKANPPVTVGRVTQLLIALAAGPVRGKIAGVSGQPGGALSMMAAVFATLLLAFILDLLGLGRLALSCLFLSLVLCLGLFLWEVYSPDYGFRMPWLQVEAAPFCAPLAEG